MFFTNRNSSNNVFKPRKPLIEFLSTNPKKWNVTNLNKAVPSWFFYIEHRKEEELGIVLQNFTNYRKGENLWKRRNLKDQFSPEPFLRKLRRKWAFQWWKCLLCLRKKWYFFINFSEIFLLICKKRNPYSFIVPAPDFSGIRSHDLRHS